MFLLQSNLEDSGDDSASRISSRKCAKESVKGMYVSPPSVSKSGSGQILDLICRRGHHPLFGVRLLCACGTKLKGGFL